MKQRAGRYISFALVAIFLMGAGFSFLSYWSMTQAGYVALGILLVAATLWITEAVPLFVTSLLVLFLSIVWLAPVMREGGIPVEDSEFLSQFFSDIIVLFLGGFVLSAGLHKMQLDEWLACWMIRRTGTSIRWLLLGIMFITAILSMWLSNSATAAMMLTLVIPLTGQLPTGDRVRKAMLLAVPFAANIGGLGTPIGSPPNAIAMQYLRQAGLNPGFGAWMAIGIPGVVIMLLIAWLLLQTLYRSETTKLPGDGLERPEIEHSPALYIVLATTAVTILGWVTSSLHGYSTGTVAMIPILAFFSTGILSTKDLRSLSWDVLLLMGGGLCLGAAMSKSGLAEWLIGLLPVTGLSVYALMVIFGCVACIMSSVMSNTATANLIMPIMLGLSVEPVSPLLIGVAFACSVAMPLPVSTPPNAMAFGSGLINVSDMVKPGFILTAAGVVLAFTTGYWWWGVVGVY